MKTNINLRIDKNTRSKTDFFLSSTVRIYLKVDQGHQKILKTNFKQVEFIFLP